MLLRATASRSRKDWRAQSGKERRPPKLDRRTLLRISQVEPIPSSGSLSIWLCSVLKQWMAERAGVAWSRIAAQSLGLQLSC